MSGLAFMKRDVLAVLACHDPGDFSAVRVGVRQGGRLGAWDTFHTIDRASIRGVGRYGVPWRIRRAVFHRGRAVLGPT